MKVDNVKVYRFDRHRIRASLGCIKVGEFYYGKTSMDYLGPGIKNTDGKDTLFLCNFSVSRRYRNNGIGSRMLKYLLDTIQPNTIVVLKCLDKRLEFYKRNGFKVASINYYCDGEYVYTMYYEKSESL